MPELTYERQAMEQGYVRIAGMDEVGRGPLAGPVVTACVVLPLEEERLIEGVTDSKRLTPKRRARLEGEILARAEGWALGVVDEGTIDRINILNATRQAMAQAVLSLDPPPQLVLVDAVGGLAIPMAHTLPNTPAMALPGTWAMARRSILPPCGGWGPARSTAAAFYTRY